MCLVMGVISIVGLVYVWLNRDRLPQRPEMPIVAWVLIGLVSPCLVAALLMLHRKQTPNSEVRPTETPVTPAPRPLAAGSPALYQSPLGPLPAPLVPGSYRAGAFVCVFFSERLVDANHSAEWEAEVRSRGYEVSYIRRNSAVIGWKIIVPADPERAKVYAYA